MKYLIAFFILITFSYCNSKTEQIVVINQNNKEFETVKMDTIKKNKAKAVIKAKALNTGVGDKYLYQKIEVLEVIKNNTNFIFKDTLTVAHYSWKLGVPLEKECIIYLTPWPYGSETLNEEKQWMLLDGDGEYACEIQK